MADDPYHALKSALRALPKSELKRFWADLGYILQPAAPEWLDRPLAPLQEERLVDAIFESLLSDLVAAGLLTDDAAGHARAKEIARAFYDLAPQSPLPAKKGGNGFNGSLQIFAIARLLQPEIIIESGVFRGQTSWVLRQACPDATLFCFDVDFSNLVYRDRNAIYTQADWSAFDVSALAGRKTLCFFDDHIDQGRRVLECRERGFDQLLFDDNAPAERIHTVGGPPVPSLDMLMDPALDGQELSWSYRGRTYGCHIDTAQAKAVRQAIATMRNFADMHRVTGYTPARITYVALHNR